MTRIVVPSNSISLYALLSTFFHIFVKLHFWINKRSLLEAVEKKTYSHFNCPRNYNNKQNSIYQNQRKESFSEKIPFAIRLSSKFCTITNLQTLMEVVLRYPEADGTIRNAPQMRPNATKLPIWSNRVWTPRKQGCLGSKHNWVVTKQPHQCFSNPSLRNTHLLCEPISGILVFQKQLNASGKWGRSLDKIVGTRFQKRNWKNTVPKIAHFQRNFSEIRLSRQYDTELGHEHVTPFHGSQ